MQTTTVLSDYELERGKPMPSRNHALAQYRLITAFSQHGQEYSILPELTLELDGRPFTPDISVYPRLTVDWQHDEIKMTEPPLMTVEILSPKQSLDDLVRKTDAYFKAGVKSCWIVQPTVEAVVVLEAGRKPKVYSEGEVVDPATQVTVRLIEIFG